MCTYIDVRYDIYSAHGVVVGIYVRGLVVRKRVNFAVVGPFENSLRRIIAAFHGLGVHFCAHQQIISIGVDIRFILLEQIVFGFLWNSA